MEKLDKKMAVFTTSQVVMGKEPITYVVHDDEGDWQFLCSIGASMSEAMIVTMSEILKIDSSLKEILWIPEGTEARRSSIGGEWITSTYVEE